MVIRKRPNLLLKIIAIASIIFGLAIINGCSNSSPLSHEADQNASPFDIYEYPGSLSKFDLIATDSTSDSIGIEGGNIEILLRDYAETKLELQIPDGALKTAKVISCELSSFDTERGRSYVFEFGPDGTVFDTAAILELKMEVFDDYNPRDLAYLGAEMFWWNPEDSCWEFQGTDFEIDDGKVQFNIHHFSKYALGGRHSRVGNDTRVK